MSRPSQPAPRSPQPRLGVALAFLTGARLVVNTAQRFVYPFLPAIARGLGVSLDTAGYLVSARWVVGAATPGVVAALGRGERRRRLIGFGLVLFAVGAAVTAATGVFAGALAGFMLMGLGKPVFDISAQAYLADRVDYASRARYVAVLELTWAGGLLVGAPVAGWLIERAGWEAPFWGVAALAVAAVALQVRVLEPDAPASPRALGGLRWDRPAVMFLAVIALFTGAAELMFVVLGAWLETEFSLSLVALGGSAVLIGFVELGAEGSTVAFTDRIGKRRSVAIGLLVSASGFGLVALTGGSLVYGMGALLVGIAGFEFTIVSSIPLATQVRPHGRARYLSWMIVAMAAGRAAGAAAGLPVFDAGGIVANAVGASVANIAAIALLAWWVGDVEDTGSDFPADFVLPE